MARPSKNVTNLQQKWDKEPLGPGAVRPRKGKRPRKLDEIEIMTAVCELFCSGMPTSQVRQVMKERYGPAGSISREDTYNYLNRAAHLGWFSYSPPSHREHSQRLLDEHSWLQDAHVIHTATAVDVAKAGARMVYDLLKGDPRDEVHIGLAGGFMVRRVVEELAKLLCNAQKKDDIPARLVFRSLGGESDSEKPAADPTTFFTFFEDQPDLRTKVHFVGFRGPPIARPDHADMLRTLPGMREPFDEAEEIDIVLTSGALWTDRHSVLRQLLDVDRDAVARLEQTGCVGDLMRRPIGPGGPLDAGTPVQPFTLFDLADLARMVRQGKHVVFTLGPCARCRIPKGELLEAVLACDPPVVTHLVTDSGTARECFEGRGD
jgi:DNA-binding transcriptional regulator LsrR (DeoR family)